MLCGNSRQNLATFCQTWLELEVHDIMNLTIDKNMIDKDEYPQTAELEARCVHMLADLWNSPEAANTLGAPTREPSEAEMLGGMALLWKTPTTPEAKIFALRPVPPSLLAWLISLVGGFSLGSEVPTGMLTAGFYDLVGAENVLIAEPGYGASTDDACDAARKWLVQAEKSVDSAVENTAV